MADCMYAIKPPLSWVPVNWVEIWVVLGLEAQVLVNITADFVTQHLSGPRFTRTLCQSNWSVCLCMFNSRSWQWVMSLVTSTCVNCMHWSLLSWACWHSWLTGRHSRLMSVRSLISLMSFAATKHFQDNNCVRIHYLLKCPMDMWPTLMQLPLGKATYC